MAEIDPVVLRLIADNNAYISGIRSSTRTVEQQLGLQEKRVKKLESEMRASSSRIGSTLKGLAGTLATYFTGRELVGLLDSFTRLQNNMRVAGVEGGNLKIVQDRLFDSAQKYGVELEGLSALYSSLSQASKDLGATQEQVFTVTDAVSASLKVTGTSAQAASGALLQLQQLFRGSMVQAQEYNSLIDTLYPLLEAVAAGSDKWGGSVGKLTNDVRASKVTTQEFFEALLKGSDVLEGKAAKATLTLSAGLTTLTNALTVYFGEADHANGVSAALGETLQRLADNLDTLIPALAIVATALGVGVVTNAVRAQIALAGVAGTAATAGRAILAAFGGPVGLAITAVVVGLGQAAIASKQAEAAMLANARAAQELGLKLTKTGEAALAAGGETKGVGNSAASSEPKIWSFANAVDGLTKSLWEQAKAARAARVELLKNMEGQADERIRAAKGNTTAGQAEQYAQGGAQLRQGDVLGGAGNVLGAAWGRINNFLRGGKPGREAEAIIKDANAVRDAVVKQIIELQSTPIGVSDVPEGGGGSSTPATKTKKPKKGPKGRNPADVEAGYLSELDQYRSQIAAAESQMARNAEEEAEFSLRQLESSRRQTIRSIETDHDLNQAQKDHLKAALESAVEVERAAIEFQKQRRVEQEIADLAEERHRGQMDALQAQLDLTDSERGRKDIALKIFDAEEAYLRSKLEAITLSETANDAERQRAQIALDALNANSGARRAGVERSNATETERYLQHLNRSTAAINESLDGIKIDGLEALNDGLTDAIMGTKSLGETFRNVANQIISDLVRIGIQQAITKPLANALFGGGGLGSLFGGGAPTDLLGGTPFGGGRAGGGAVSAGRAYRVGESGEEFFFPDRSGVIVPNQRMASTQGGDGGVATVRLELSGDIDARIQRVSGPVAIEVVRASAPELIDASANETMRRASRPRL